MEHTLDTQTLHARHALHLQNIFPDRAARLSWSRDQILAFQLEELRQLISHAKKHSQWHRERLADFDAEGLTVAELSGLPTMTKADLMENWDSIVTVPGATLADAQRFIDAVDVDRYYLGTHHLVSSGGSSGRTAIVLYDWDAFAEHIAGFTRAYLPAMVHLTGSMRPRVVAVGASSAQHISVALSQTFSNPSNPIRFVPITSGYDQLAIRLEALDPEVIQSFPSALSVLVNQAERGKLRIAPKLILSSSEPLNAELRARIERVWPAMILDFWSCSEASGSFPCLHSPGFHISEDLNIVEEIRRDDGRSDGILVTNLYNKALPLIRYKIDDLVSVSIDQCPCGVCFQKIDSVDGRVDKVFEYGGGIFVHPVMFETILAALPQVINYQVHKQPTGLRVVLLKSGEIDIDLMKRRLVDGLKQAGLERPVVDIEIADRIERLASGKLPSAMIT